METSLEEVQVPEAVNEEEITSEEVPVLFLSGGDGNGVKLLSSQTITLTPYPSSSGTAGDSGEIERLKEKLLLSREKIAEQRITIGEKDNQLMKAVDLVKQLSRTVNLCDIDELKYLVDEERARRLVSEEEFDKLKSSLKSMAEQYFVVTDKEEQAQNLASPSTSAAISMTTGNANEVMNILGNQPGSHGNAVEQAEMPEQCVK